MDEYVKWFINEDGQGMVEYGLIIGFISLAAIMVLLLLYPRIRNLFQSADDALATAEAYA